MLERDECRNTIMPGGQDPALLMIRYSVCICATRRGDDSSVLVALVGEIHELRPCRVATCAPTPLPPLLPVPTISICLFLSFLSLIHLYFAIVSQRPLSPSLGFSGEHLEQRREERSEKHEGPPPFSPSFSLSPSEVGGQR